MIRPAQPQAISLIKQMCYWGIKINFYVCLYSKRLGDSPDDPIMCDNDPFSTPHATNTSLMDNYYFQPTNKFDTIQQFDETPRNGNNTSGYNAGGIRVEADRPIYAPTLRRTRSEIPKSIFLSQFWDILTKCKFSKHSSSPSFCY